MAVQQEQVNLNPSMIFTWNNTKSVAKAKAFGVKRTRSHPPTHNRKKLHTNPVENTSYQQTPKLIKRKRKKDLNEPQQASDDDDDFEFRSPKTNNHSQPNRNKPYSLFDEKPKRTFIDTPTGKSVFEKVFTSTGDKFSDISGIHRHILSNLEKHDFIAMTTVQAKALPVILAGKNTLVRSQTGSGKTLAYAVPIIEALQSVTPRLTRNDGVQAVVVVPTRELALQTHEQFNKVNTFQWIITGHLCGGENRKTEKVRLRKGVHVLIGTPGRLLDHVLHTSALKLDKVKCLVLDEADRLLDMGFRKDIVRLVEELDKSKHQSSYDALSLFRKNKQNDIPAYDVTEQPLDSINRQTILLSATLTKGVTELADFAMADHVYVDALEDASLVPTNSLIIPSTVKQLFILTYVKHRLFTLSALIADLCKRNSKAFVFMASSQMVEFHHELFTNYLVKMPKNRGRLKTGNVVLFEENPEEDSGDEEEVVLDVPIFKLHGSMDQKQRKDVFGSFRAAKKGVLLCTDVGARGLDVPAADCIVQYTGPQTDDDYLHRVGRTGRAGKSGTSIIFLTHEEQEYVTRLQDHKVFLKEREQSQILKRLCELMDEPDVERAATALQRRYEAVVSNNRDLHRSACFAYSSWSRFYNSYPSAMRSIFDFKKVNLGHYVTSFAVRDTPSAVAKVVRGEVKTIESPRLNKKLSNHQTEESQGRKKKPQQKSISLITSEYSSGLEPTKKKVKKKE